MSIVFIGDIHQDWRPIEHGLGALSILPSAAVLLGDIQCDRTLDVLAAPLLDRGIAVHWIFGNHDNDGGPEMWANLTDPARNPRTAGGALHGRVRDIAGVRVAGLGGTFRPRIWHPPAPPRVRERALLAREIAAGAPSWTPTHHAAVVHSLGSAAIWPEDYEALAAQQADILVTHEAPSSHDAGSATLDALGRAMGVRLIVHGHHHVTYQAQASDGLKVMGVAPAWGLSPEGRVLWEGEKPRPPRHLPPGWYKIDAKMAIV